MVFRFVNFHGSAFLENLYHVSRFRLFQMLGYHLNLREGHSVRKRKMVCKIVEFEKAH